MIGAAITTEAFEAFGLLFTLGSAFAVLALAAVPGPAPTLIDQRILAVLGGIALWQAVPSTLGYFARDTGVATGLTTWVIGVALIFAGTRRLVRAPLTVEVPAWAVDSAARSEAGPATPAFGTEAIVLLVGRGSREAPTYDPCRRRAACRIPSEAMPGTREGAVVVTEPMPAADAAWLRVDRPHNLMVINTMAHPSRLVTFASTVPRVASTLAKELLSTRVAPSTFAGRIGADKAVAWSPTVPVDTLKATAHALGVTLNDLVLAAIAGALRRCVEESEDTVRDLRVMVPFNVRMPN